MLLEFIQASLFLFWGTECSTTKDCRLSPQVFNKIFGSKIEEKGFGVEPGVGLIFNVSSNTVDSAFEETLEWAFMKSNYTEEELRPCLKLYLSEPKTTQTPPQPQFSNLHYDQDSFNTIPIPEPDEDYLPGPEGYTTYMKPHNFAGKMKGYRPSFLDDRNGAVAHTINLFASIDDRIGDMFESIGIL